MTTLLPCPFCGVVPVEVSSGNRHWLEADHKLGCYLGETCESQYQRSSEMVGQWNRRIQPTVTP